MGAAGATEEDGMVGEEDGSAGGDTRAWAGCGKMYDVDGIVVEGVSRDGGEGRQKEKVWGAERSEGRTSEMEGK